MARSKMMLAAQWDGKRNRLFLIGGQRVVRQDEYPDAAPAGFGPDRPLIHFFDDVWSFTPGAQTEAGTWRKLGDIGLPFAKGGRAAGSAVAIGRSRILLLTSAKDDLLRLAYGPGGKGWGEFPMHPGFEREALIYDAREDRWMPGPLAPMAPDPLEGASHPVAAAAVTTSAVCVAGRIILPVGEVRPRVRSPKIWSVDLGALGVRCSSAS